MTYSLPESLPRSETVLNDLPFLPLRFARSGVAVSHEELELGELWYLSERHFGEYLAL